MKDSASQEDGARALGVFFVLLLVAFAINGWIVKEVWL